MNFDVFGPFELPRNELKTLIDRKRLDDLRKAIENEAPGLSDACGCYVFAMRSGGGYTPWYVGRTKLNTIFREATSADKLNKYADVLNDTNADTNQQKIGTPVLFVIPMLAANGDHFKNKNQNLPEINFLES